MAKDTKKISNVNDSDFMGASNTFEVLLPDNNIIKLRERNGDDEDALSRNKDFSEGNSMAMFLAKLIISKPTPVSEINKWPVRCKYYLILKERIQTWGKDIEFEYMFENGDKFMFTEDLSQFDWDFTQGPPPKKGDKDYNEQRIVPYPVGKTMMEGTTSSGKNWRAKYLTGEGEMKVATKTIGDLTINDKLRIRDFELQHSDNSWVKIERFNMLSAKDMAEIRSRVVAEDPDFSMTIELKHPSKPIIEYVSALALPGFFFPKA